MNELDKEKNVFSWKLRKSFPFLFVLFSFLFSFIIFAPAEVFFANAGDFEFVYSDFCGLSWGLVTGITVFAAMSLLIFPFSEKAQRILCCLFGCINISSYLQVMFLNKHSSLMGTNANGYILNRRLLLLDSVVWLSVFCLVFFLLNNRTRIKYLLYLVGFVTILQVIAYSFLLINADRKELLHEDRLTYASGKDQFRVSPKENIIIFVLDNFSTGDLDALLAVYPDAIDFLDDFTFYSDCCATYDGTYPSVCHILTGQNVEPDLTCDEWTSKSWESPVASAFYKGLHDKGYKVNIYSQGSRFYYSNNDLNRLRGKVDNIVTSDVEYKVNKVILARALANFVMYRNSPEAMKPIFYEDNLSDKVVDIVLDGETGTILHDNPDFIAHLEQNGLTALTDESRYFIYQHVRGTHNFTTDEDGGFLENSTREKTAKGSMLLMEKYLNEMKKIGAYDNSLIIITADHCHLGDFENVIFFIKQKGQRGRTEVCAKPISHDSLLATIADLEGIDLKDDACDSIFANSEQTVKNRYYYVRKFLDDYPRLRNYNGTKPGTENVYLKYSFTGNVADLSNELTRGDPEIIPMGSSFY